MNDLTEVTDEFSYVLLITVLLSLNKVSHTIPSRYGIIFGIILIEWLNIWMKFILKSQPYLYIITPIIVDLTDAICSPIYLWAMVGKAVSPKIKRVTPLLRAMILIYALGKQALCLAYYWFEKNHPVRDAIIIIILVGQICSILIDFHVVYEIVRVRRRVGHNIHSKILVRLSLHAIASLVAPFFQMSYYYKELSITSVPMIAHTVLCLQYLKCQNLSNMVDSAYATDATKYEVSNESNGTNQRKSSLLHPAWMHHSPGKTIVIPAAKSIRVSHGRVSHG